MPVVRRISSCSRIVSRVPELKRKRREGLQPEQKLEVYLEILRVDKDVHVELLREPAVIIKTRLALC